MNNGTVIRRNRKSRNAVSHKSRIPNDATEVDRKGAGQEVEKAARHHEPVGMISYSMFFTVAAAIYPVMVFAPSLIIFKNVETIDKSIRSNITLLGQAVKILIKDV